MGHNGKEAKTMFPALPATVYRPRGWYDKQPIGGLVSLATHFWYALGQGGGGDWSMRPGITGTDEAEDHAGDQKENEGMNL